MNFAVLAGIGILLVLTIIGLLVLLRRNSFESENKKRNNMEKNSLSYGESYGILTTLENENKILDGRNPRLAARASNQIIL